MNNESDQVILHPKKWYRITIYVAAPVFLVLSVTNLHIFGNSPTSLEKITAGEFWSVVPFISSILMIILCIFLVPYIYKKKIIFDVEGIRQEGLISKQIPYTDIEKIKVMKGHVEISGDQFLNKIALGNLHTHFDEAIMLLSRNISEIREGIKFAGSDEQIRNYFDGN